MENFILAIIVSFLFAGIIENYKSKEGLNTLILETYKNIETEGLLCFRTHNNLVLAYTTYAGIFLTEGQELNKLILYRENIPLDYEMWLKALIDSQQNQSKLIEDLKDKMQRCYSEFYLESEELAILLGKLDKYKRILKDRRDRINITYKQQQQKLRSITKDFNMQKFIDFFRYGLKSAIFQNFLLKGEKDWIKKFDDLSEIQVILAEYEKKRFEIELNTYKKLRNLYLPTLKRKITGGFINFIFGSKE